MREQFGDIDVYLFDQLLPGRIVSGMKVLDAGCGSGRNLIFLVRAGFDVWAPLPVLRRGSRPIQASPHCWGGPGTLRDTLINGDTQNTAISVGNSVPQAH